MAFEHKELRGSVFANDRPGIHLGGEVKVNGQVYWITIWDRDEGKTHWGVSLKPKTAKRPETPADPAMQGPVDLDDEIPFAPEVR